MHGLELHLLEELLAGSIDVLLVGEGAHMLPHLLLGERNVQYEKVLLYKKIAFNLSKIVLFTRCLVNLCLFLFVIFYVFNILQPLALDATQHLAVAAFAADLVGALLLRCPKQECSKSSNIFEF